MKKWTVILLVMVGLCGCSASSEEMDRGMEFRTRLLKASGFSFDADITADYGDKLYQFSMSCGFDKNGNMVFTVTNPETIAGITGKVNDAGGALTFDDTALCFEVLTDDQISPVSAPWLLVKTLRSGYLRFVEQEDDGLRLTIDDSYEDDALMLDIWLDKEDLPKRAEILYGGRRILTLLVKNAAIV